MAECVVYVIYNSTVVVVYIIVYACTMQSHANVALTEKIASQVCTFRENTSQVWYVCKRQSHTNVALTEKIASLICVCRGIE